MFEMNFVGLSDVELFYGIFLYILIVNLFERFVKNDYWFQMFMLVNEYVECCFVDDLNFEVFI